jgi:hypothetical protein
MRLVGTFTVKTWPARPGRNPKTGESINIPETLHPTPHFHAIAPDQGTCNRVENGIDALFNVLGVHVRGNGCGVGRRHRFGCR